MLRRRVNAGSHHSLSLSPLGFGRPIDSRPTSTPWSVFQDGSDGVPGTTQLGPHACTRRRQQTDGARPTKLRAVWRSGPPATDAAGSSRRTRTRQALLNRAADDTHPACNTTAEAVATLPRRFRRPPSRSLRFAAAKCTARRNARLNDDGKLAQFRPFASQQFHVLLNSLFKVLCNFPSRYLFAIGVRLGI